MVTRPFRRERWANSASDTLSAGAAATDTTISVNSATEFPTSGDFRILIDDSEEAVVRAVSGTTFTLTTGLTGTYSSGASVELVPTASGLDAAFNEAWGAQTYPMNRVLNHLGQTLTDSDFSWYNQGTATSADADDGGLNLYGPTSEGLNQLRGKYVATPATPWKVTAFCQFGPGMKNFSFPTTGSNMGLFLEESSTGELYYLFSRSDVMGFWRMTNATTFSADVNSLFFPSNGRSSVWLQIEDDGTDIKAGMSWDGKAFFTAWSESRTAFMAGGPDRVGFGMMSGNASNGAHFYFKSFIFD